MFLVGDPLSAGEMGILVANIDINLHNTTLCANVTLSEF